MSTTLTLPTNFSAAVALEQWANLYSHADSLFSLSPLTSPEHTPPSSPILPSNVDLQSHGRITSDAFVNDGCQLNPSPLPVPLFPHSSPSCVPAVQPQPSLPARASGNVSTMEGPSSNPKLPVKDAKKSKPPHRAARQHAAANAARAHQRDKAKGGQILEPAVREAPHRKYVKGAKQINTTFVTESARVARTGFIGINDRSRSKRVYHLEEVTGVNSELQFKLVKWDGRQPMFISDSDGRALVILAGYPEDQGWPILMELAADSLEVARSRFVPPKSENRRGTFDSLHCGVSFGGGQTSPSNLRNEKVNKVILEWLCNLEPFKRLAGFASSAMHTWANDLFCAYAENLKELHKDPELKRVFPNSIFSAATFNMGPCTVCTKHKDFSNLPYGYCAVTALGDFDPRQGGHLILWELGLVVEFPPGSTILLPSALISHSNTAISQHEKRYSFTQYTAGGLFRWVAHGCRTKDKYLATLTPDRLASYVQEESER
ncbi:hypothetical protein JR316_0012061 [Psilocybe cubensis]|uniref:Uncharacterized protein n=1 Tax=Psilocybe cubensis TaxID=181762 RepID=A0ACB8GHS8_PSICU|nr:hypothetical protein JR316_0012061 [Psilocybe cubensis]KAH9474962.1 hypothetical protein JR316_0012061 [Psilocybe cubensis]